MNESKNSLYNDILKRLAGWFGMRAEDVTEAELHQRIVERDDVVKEMRAQIDDLREQLREHAVAVEGLKTKIDEHAKVIEEQATTIAQLIEEREKLKKDLDGANSALEAQIKSNRELAAEIARMRAGAIGNAQAAVDTDEHLSRGVRSGGTVIPAGELFKNLTRN
jgi:SMC interacting uncharacterized protein involved in chromosome segregation